MRTSTVLLVEDEALVRDLLAKILRRAGYVVLEAEDGEAAVDLAARYGDRIDVVVTDIAMPRLGGIEAAGALVAARPGMLVVYMSGHLDDERELAAGPEGGFLRKPFEPDALVAKLGEVLDRETAGAALRECDA
jgi:two-component system, cell cycle sensor histidine kinase and response regulator CckA